MNDAKRPEPVTDKEYARDGSGSINLPQSGKNEPDIEKLLAALVRIFAARGIELCVRYERKDGNGGGVVGAS